MNCKSLVGGSSNLYNLISSLKKSTVDYEGARCNEPVMKGHFSMILAHFVRTKQTLLYTLRLCYKLRKKFLGYSELRKGLFHRAAVA